MADAISFHVQWVTDYLQDDSTRELAMLDEARLKVVMREARSTKPDLHISFGDTIESWFASLIRLWVCEA